MEDIHRRYLWSIDHFLVGSNKQHLAYMYLSDISVAEIDCVCACVGVGGEHLVNANIHVWTLFMDFNKIRMCFLLKHMRELNASSSLFLSVRKFLR